MLSQDLGNIHSLIRQTRNDFGELHLTAAQVGILLENLSAARVTAIEMEQHVIADDPCQVVVSLMDFKTSKNKTGPPDGGAA